ncbi:RNA polymerase III [Aureococcus anophagefferens]|uniref:RNA polymerase III n=1 Tax=Aureococcus anophagefferens TaxID=44056 RepID=A0ABR1G033_AURAN
MDVKEKFLELLGAAQGDAGVSNETLQRKFPGESYAALLPVINELLAENRLELLKEEGKQDLTYRLRDKAQAES